MKTTLCLLGWRRELAIRLPEGLKHHHSSNHPVTATFLEQMVRCPGSLVRSAVRYLTHVDTEEGPNLKLYIIQVLTVLLPAKRIFQAINGLTGGLEDNLSVPDPDLPGASVRTNGTDGK